MRITLLALAAVAILAQQALAEPSIPIPGCLETFKIPKKGITPQNLFDWNTCLRHDCLNLDVENDICVKGPLTMGPAIPCKHATNSNVPKTQAASTNAGSMPQPKATRPLYPNMVPPKAVQQQQPPKPMAQSPKAESAWSPVPGGASQAPNPSSVLG
ncbi:hypothetical protein BG005_002001 [Podila minutissima]|nr:hypothetical protein BG005_002001 [Podila minutissima]